MSYSSQPHGLQHARLPCPSLSPGVCSNSCPLSQWCHSTISSSATPFSSCPQSFPGSRSFPVIQLFASGGQIIGASASASVLPVHIQGCFPLGWTGFISLQSKGLSRVFSSTTLQKHQPGIEPMSLVSLALQDSLPTEPPGKPAHIGVVLSIIFMGSKITLFSWAPKWLQMVTTAMKLKDTYSLKEKLWPT